MIDEADPHGGLARAALTLATAIIAEVRRSRLTGEQARSIFQYARFLARDPESFAANSQAAEAAGNVLSISQAMAELQASLPPPCATLVHDASARQHSGEPSSLLGPGPGDPGKSQLRNPDSATLDCELVGLLDQATTELRRAWRSVHHRGPPPGLSRDLIIRGSPTSCNSAPMPARAARSSAVWTSWRESSGKALSPSIPAEC